MCDLFMFHQMRGKKIFKSVTGSHSQEWPCRFLCWDQKPGCFEKCYWLITTPLPVGWERVIMPASLLFHHRYFTALQHQVTNMLIIMFLTQNSSGRSPSLLALAFRHSPAAQLWTAVNFCNQRAALWKPACWAGRGYQACCVQTLATGDLVSSLSSSFCPSPSGSSAAQSQKLCWLL